MTADLGDITTYLSQGRSRPAAALLAAVGSFVTTTGHTPREIRTLEALAAGLPPHLSWDDLEHLADLTLGQTELPPSIQRALTSLVKHADSVDSQARSRVSLPDMVMAERSAMSPHPALASHSQWMENVTSPSTFPVEVGPDFSSQDPAQSLPEEDVVVRQAAAEPHLSNLRSLGDIDRTPKVGSNARPDQPSARLESDLDASHGGSATLDLSTVLALIESGDIDECAKMVRTAKGDLPYAVIRRLTMMAQDWPLLAQALADRPEMLDADLIPLFPHLGKRGRHRVIAALELLALKELVHRRGIAARPELSEGERLSVAKATELAQRGDATHLIEVLARLLGVAVPLVEVFILDRGGEALTIAMRATGLPIPLATPIFELNAAFFGQGESLPARLKLFESLSVRACQIAIDHWRGPFVRAQHANPTTGQYRPSDILRPTPNRASPSERRTDPMNQHVRSHLLF